MQIIDDDDNVWDVVSVTYGQRPSGPGWQTVMEYGLKLSTDTGTEATKLLRVGAQALVDVGSEEA